MATPKWPAGIDLVKTELKNAIPHFLSSAPSSPGEGQVYYDSASKVLGFYNGSSWVYVGRLDQISPPTGDVSMSSHKITNLTDPSSPQDAATKAYADLLRQGIADALHDPVRVAVSSNVNTASPGASPDGVSLSASDRVLLYGQSTGTQNGIWVWNGAAVAMTRATDADATGEVIDGSLVAVQEGTHAGWLMIQTATPSGGIGSWTQTWIQYSTGSTYSADGTTIQLSGSTFSLVTPVAIASGGTNATTAAAARTNLVAITGYEATVGDGAATTITITHSLGTKDVSVDVYDTATDDKIYPGINRATTNTVQITESVAPANNSRRVVIHARA